MNKLSVLSLSLLAAAVPASQAMAGSHSESSAIEVSANVTLTSDYVFRGVSQTTTLPAIQGGFDVEFGPGIYVGTWASNVDGGTYTGSSMEWDFYFGWAGEISDTGIGIDVGYLRYQYPGTSVNANNTDEYHVGFSYDFGMASVGYTFNYSPDFYGAQDADYHSFGVDIPVNDNISVGLSYGFTDYDDNTLGDDYEDYSISVSTSALGLDLGLAYTDTSGTPVTPDNDGRVTFSVGKSF